MPMQRKILSMKKIGKIKLHLQINVHSSHKMFNSISFLLKYTLYNIYHNNPMIKIALAD